MSMTSLQVSVATGSVTQLSAVSIQITGRCSIQNLGAGTVYVLASSGGAPANAAAISGGGYQVTAGNPFEIEDPNGTPQPDLMNYYATATGLIAGDLRIIT